MIQLKLEDKEINIQLKYYKPEGKNLQISIYGEGDLSHHLIEGLFEIIDKLSAMEGCNHLSTQWKELSDSHIKAKMRDIDAK